MLRGVLFFATLVAGWVTALWFGVAPDFGHWSLPRLAAVHALPPLFCGGAWFGWRRWRTHVAEARARAAEAGAEKERIAAENSARKLAAEEAQRQRFGCDCRAVAMAQVIGGDDEMPLAEAQDGVYFSPFDPDSTELKEGTDLLTHLREGIHEAMGAIYESIPAAMSLPVYVVLPGKARADEFVATVRMVQQALLEEGAPLFDGTEEPGRILQLVEGRSALSGLVELFERTPGLAIVLLGTDSPWLDLQQREDEESANENEAEKPGQGVFAMLLTHPDLAGDEPDDTRQEASSLRSLPVLARLHRPATVGAGGGKMRANALARTVGSLMTEAQRYAGLDQAPPAGDGEDGESGGACSWLVHNAGTPGNCGTRMAGLGVALLEHGIELDPFEEATNISTSAGDLGDARGIGMLAVAVSKAAATEGAALCVEFCRDETLSLFFARAPESADIAVG